MNGSQPALIDTDPGLDDTLALAFALRSSKLDVQAITVVAGNVPLSVCTANALRVLEVFASDAPPPVYEGCGKPLSPRVSRAEHVHAADGIGGVSGAYPIRRLRPAGAHAADAMIGLARRYRGDLVRIALGPLTNVAVALQRDREAMRGIRELVVMGGSIDGTGNATPHAEFNFYSDPIAAREVLRSGLPVTLVGLNVTASALLPRARFDARVTAMRPGLQRQFLRDVAGPYFDFCKKEQGRDACALHDPLAVAAAVDPEVVRTQRIRCDVVASQGITRGQLVAERDSGRSGALPARVATEVDGERFHDLFLDILCGS